MIHSPTVFSAATFATSSSLSSNPNLLRAPWGREAGTVDAACEMLGLVVRGDDA
jgi:hypothetical protein